jgi:hypothetical protein
MVLSNALVGAFIYGMLTQRVKDQSGWLKRHEGELSKHADTLTDHEGRISHLEGWKGISR